MKVLLVYIMAIFVFILQGCSRFPVEDRVKYADFLANKAGWKKEILHTDLFEIQSYLSNFESAELITVYIEGDGLAWVSKTKPSSNPTPINPLALRLALKDQGNAVYLSRPCQFLTSPSCSQRYWTNERFAPVIVDAMNDVVSIVKAKTLAKKVVLVGYSGGGAIAALIAATRNDVIRLITVAGNLDHQIWTEKLNVSPLTGSLNSADYWHQLIDIPQLHLVGEFDQSVPLFVIESFQARFSEGKKPKIKIVEGFDHQCCWVEQWPELAQ